MNLRSNQVNNKQKAGKKRGETKKTLQAHSKIKVMIFFNIRHLVYHKVVP